MGCDSKPFLLGEDHLTAGAALALAEGRRRAVLGPSARTRIETSAATVAGLAGGAAPVYGINTGFGPLCTSRISPEDTRALQRNLLMSHACGVGEPVALPISRLMLVLKVHALAQGHSGVAPGTIERILWHLAEDIIPLVPSQGSVGASGDLAPLSHLFLPLIGLGQVSVRGQVLPAGDLLAERGLAPLELGPKEGLALINGTQFIAAHAVAAVARFHNLLDHADLAGALSLEALSGSNRPFLPELHTLRPHDGCRHVADRLMELLADSAMLADHRNCLRVQDPYSLRCMPQIHGASRNAWRHLRDTVEVEINAVTDNPVILDDGRSISGGHFHGQPLALPLDYTALAASELGNVSDRRSYLLLLGNDRGLPRLLLQQTGLQSGFMILQYTSAALTSENKSFCFPASADSIPTSLGQEDHVSMGSISGRKLHMILDNLEKILAVELVLAAQGFEFRRPLRSSSRLEAVQARIRQAIPAADADRVFCTDLAAATALVKSGDLPRVAALAETQPEGAPAPLADFDRF